MSGNRPSVLLVDPAADQREMYRTHLEDCGFTTWEADDLPSAVALCNQVRPSVVVMELTLSQDRDGVELLARLREDGETSSVPVVVLTASVFPADREVAVRAGCELFVPKPCVPDELARLVSALLRTRCCVLEG